MLKLKSNFLFYALGLIALGLVVGCASEEKISNTPEAVARQWQDYIDENQFNKARSLSAPSAIEWLDWIAETLTEDMLKEDTLAPGTIIQMNCVENGNQASCPYSFDDNGFVYEDTFKLLKIKGRWLVDIPIEALSENEWMDELFQEVPSQPEAQ